MVLCLMLLAFSKALRFDQSMSQIIFRCLYTGAIVFFLSATSRLFLDIMYGILGLLQVKVSSLLSWFTLSILSLVSIVSVFAALRLAAGFKA